MEGPNYFRTAYEFLHRGNVKRVPGSPDQVALLKSALTAPKFALPEGGRILDNNLRCLPNVIRLPYPVVVLEYFHNENYLKGIAEEATREGIPDRVLQLMTHGMYTRDKIIVIASQPVSGGPISVGVISHIPAQKDWVVAPFICSMPADKGDMLQHLESGRIPTELFSETSLSKVWFEKLSSATLTGPVKAICELCEAFAFSNISEQEIPAKKMTFTEQRKKALPYDSYRVLVVNKKERIVSAGRTETGPCGERRQSREHDRRGHDRTYKRSGKIIWINPMIVNAGVGGRIIKDYQLK
jgi:hypothetical protein